MTDDAHARLVGALKGKRRRVYDVIVEHGPVTQREIHGHLGGRSGGVSLGEYLRPLGAHGLIRDAGERKESRSPSRLWEAVPAAEVEQAARRWKAQGQTPKERLENHRALKPGSHSDFYHCRDRLLELTVLLARIEPMVFWEAAEGADLDELYDDLSGLGDWLDRITRAIDQRRDYDGKRAKIAKLRATNGRTSAEAKAYRRKADDLEATLHKAD
jgi:hypothetical protein